MLVDLARNDLSRNARNVEVLFYKEPQYYSYVIHLVSRVGRPKGGYHLQDLHRHISCLPSGQGACDAAHQRD